MSIDTTKRVAKFLSILLERKLTYDERIQLTQVIKQNIVAEDDTPVNVIQIANIAKKYYELINTNKYSICSFLGETSFTQPNRAYLCLDSRYAIFNNERTKLSWCISESLNNYNNTASLLGGVRNINWIRLQSVVVRKFSSVPQRSTILIEELASQSFIMPGGRKFHFVGLLNDIQNPVPISGRNESSSFLPPDVIIFDKYELLSGYKFNEGYYRFNTPISMLNNITISIGNPDQLVVIPKYEYLTCNIVALTTESITIELNDLHNLTAPNDSINVGTWYSVFVDGLNTGNTANADYETYVNTHEHTSITLATSSRLLIEFKDLAAGDGLYGFAPMNTQTYTTVPLSQISTVRVRINSYRVIINMEMEYTG